MIAPRFRDRAVRRSAQERAQLDRLRVVLPLQPHRHPPAARDVVAEKRCARECRRSVALTTGSTFASAASFANTGPSKSTTKPRLSSGLLAVAVTAARLRRPSDCGGTRRRPPSATAAGIRRRAAAAAAAASRGTQYATMLSLVSSGVGNLHQLDAAGAPVAERLDPGARPRLVARLEVLVVGEAAVALHAGRSRAGLVSANDVTSSRFGLTSGRQIHSPVPDWIDSPSESCTSGRKSLAAGGGWFSPKKYMLRERRDARAWSTSSRRKMRALTSMAVSMPGFSTKRYAPVDARASRAAHRT